MKLYYFNPNDYGQEYFVMAENKIKAHQYLIKYFKNKKANEKPNSYEAKSCQEDIDMWAKVNPFDASTFPCKYTLDEKEEGCIIHSEIA